MERRSFNMEAKTKVEICRKLLSNYKKGAIIIRNKVLPQIFENRMKTFWHAIFLKQNINKNSLVFLKLILKPLDFLLDPHFYPHLRSIALGRDKCPKWVSGLDIGKTQSRAADPKYGEGLVEVAQVSGCLLHAYLLRCSWDVPSKGDPVLGFPQRSWPM